VPQDEITAIEHAELDRTQVGTLAAYVEALGGRLELVADFGADRIQLR